VLYECSVSLETVYVSANSFELLGLRPPQLLGNRSFWENRIHSDDLPLVSQKVAELDRSRTDSAIHRIINDAGLPVWVCHSFRIAGPSGKRVIRGCIIPIPHERRLQSLEPGIIARFVHKIGNHFQVLSLVISGLKKSLPDSRPTEILENALEKAVDLTRAFSEFAQGSSSMVPTDLGDVLGAAAITKKPLFADNGVALEERFHGSVRGVELLADPYLLEAAINNVLQNALEASAHGDRVVLEAAVECTPDHDQVARVRVSDSGRGISDEKLESVLAPFFTSKNDHEGLGLSMAGRFIEMHGGRLSINSAEGKGTTVEITLPTTGPSEPGSSKRP
jgi:signal transduction histidine kinase